MSTSQMTNNHYLQPGERQFSDIVIEYQNQVENIISWLYNKEEELKKQPHEITLKDASFNSVLEEYSRHEKFISELCEYCQTIMKCKEDGQDIKEQIASLSDEDKDEIGIQMDSMLVCYEKLKILATDRLQNLQRIVDDRQLIKIERFEEWLSSIEMRLASLNNIGPNYDAIQRQIKEMQELQKEFAQKQDFLNFLSSVIIFDEVDTDSLEIRRRSCQSLDERLESLNHRWMNICRGVDSRYERLRKAESIWKLLSIEGPQLIAWLNRIESSLNELSDAARSVPNVQSDADFVAKLIARSNKIDLDIKHKQSFYTSLESRVRTEIEKFDDPCSMFIIELERKLEDMQDQWNTIMNRKRTLDFNIQTITNPESIERVTCNIIPIPDSITSSSNNNLSISTPITASNFTSNSIPTQRHLDMMDSSPSSGSNEHMPSKMANSNPDPRGFENSPSSESRSLIEGNRNISTFTNDFDSHDDLSSTSMTASYSINMTNYTGDGDSSQITGLHNPHRHDMISAEHFLGNTKEYTVDQVDHMNGSHNCRVEEWKGALESFSTWLKQVELSLSVNGTPGTNGNRNHAKHWSALDFEGQANMLNDIEQQIANSCQDEFDCLILQGQQIIEDLMPEINENEYEANMKDILADIEIRYSYVKRCIAERKHGLADKGRWYDLLKKLKNSCSYIVERMGQIMPENSIGVDLITLAQQQDQLMHFKDSLETDDEVQQSIRDSKIFLKVCDTLQKQQGRSHSSPIIGNVQKHNRDVDSFMSSTNEELWLSFRDLKEDIEVQLDRLILHYSELSQLIDDRLGRLDEVHKEMHALQHKMQELATELQVAEIMKSSWPQLDDLTIEQLSEQLEDLKLFRERFCEIESAHKTMNSIFDWMTQTDVPLSQSNMKRISELNTIYNSIEISIEERQKLIEQAFDNQSSSEQRFLTQTLIDLPRWERRVATSKVPYFINHDTNKTKWDHPKFTDMLKSMQDVDQYVFSAYRTALKLRIVQNNLGIKFLMLEQLKEIFTYAPDPDTNNQTQNSKHWALVSENNDTLVGVEQIIFYLKAIYEKIKNDDKQTLDVPYSVDLTLNWLLNLYDSTRTGYINSLSLKVGLALICCATREEKYIYMFDLVADPVLHNVDARKLGTLFESCIRIPIYLGEGESFGGTEIIETSIRNCFSISKLNPQHPNSIDLADYLNWLKSEPQFIIWLPVLHRLLISENVAHRYKCKLCAKNPIVGLRYRCLKCFKFNICQSCFLTGRHVIEHHDPEIHQMREYCCTTSSGENVRDLTKILRNKLTRPSSGQNKEKKRT